jgi:Xaa-Pro aminopeptidase
MHHTKKKLALLRKSMKLNNIDAYIIPNNDPNLGESIPGYWRIIEWLTGFTGSSATVIITSSFAGLWTDSRYFIQAEHQLYGSGFILMRINFPSDPTIQEWLLSNIKKGKTIGVDGKLISISSLISLESVLTGKKIRFDLNADLISDLWDDRPPLPDSIAFDHAVSFTGKDRKLKISEVREQMKNKKIDYHLLCSVDDIMWLLNIRANDVPYSPLLLSFAIIKEDQVLLFAHEKQIPARLAVEFDTLGINILPYEAVESVLASIPRGSAILINPDTTSASLFRSIQAGVHIT